MVENNISKVNQLKLRMPGVRALRLVLKIRRPTNPLSSTLLLAYGFAAFIILGTLLLMLPVSSESGQVTNPVDALFTATSAVCVTGLVVVDTGTYWSTSGQGVLLVLFQIGGLGFLIGATILLLAIGGRFGLKERVVITESMGLEQLGGVLGIVTKVTIFALLVEAIGAALLYFYWVSTGDTASSLWMAVFHAVSAFNNCGMDIFGDFHSLSAYQGNAVVLLITALLILFGSIGYAIFADIARKRSFVKLAFESKIVLVTVGSLLVLGMLFYLIAEFSGPATLGPLPFFQKLLNSFLLSVSTRTAGFSSFDIGALSQVSLFFTMFLMCIGGAVGSTAGGVKVNTLGIIAITVLSIIRGKENIEAFGRQLNRQIVYRALTLLLLYLVMVGIIVILLSITEEFPLDNILFETFSALGTVGLSTGITPDLSIAGRFIIIAAMFIGRLGPLALMAFLVHRKKPAALEYPYESIRLG
jgi:trk system potassium uptake protein TrkH